MVGRYWGELPFYYAAPDNRLKDFWQMLPDCWVPKDTAIVRGFFEGASGRVPWNAWLLPLTLWTLFFAALWAIGFGTAWLLTPSWLARERLNFPLAQLPLRMVRGADGRNFFASSLIWTGIVLGAAPIGLIVLFSLFRPVQRIWDLGAYFPDRPFSALRPLLIYPLMEGIGFGYLVPQDVLLSLWVFYGGLKLLALVGIGFLGWELPSIIHIGDSFPFPHAQSVGGYLAMAALLLWMSVRQGHVFRQKAAILPLTFGSLVALLWMVLSTMNLSVALLYWLALTLFVVTYTRIRSEIGMPYTWVYPYGAPRDFLHYTFGITGLMRMGGERSLVMLSGLFWVARHFYLNLNSAYAADSVKLAAEGGLPVVGVKGISLAAMGIGLWAAFGSHLQAYYRRGANFLEGAAGTADYRTYVAAQDYRLLSNLLSKPMPPDKVRIGFTVYGAVVTFTLAWLRRHFLFPLHPLGFPLAYAYSHHCPYWFPTLLTWAIKGLILRYGGMRLHRRLVPLFLGLAFGHYLMTGILWGGVISPLFKDRWPFHFRVWFE